MTDSEWTTVPIEGGVMQIQTCWEGENRYYRTRITKDLTGARVRHRTLTGQTGTVVSMLLTPDFGLIPRVHFDGDPADDWEPCGWEEVELVGHSEPSSSGGEAP